MALIKGKNAAGLVQDAIVLDFGDLRRQADRLKHTARTSAEKIIQEAESHADDLRESARKLGHEEGYASGRREGLESGRKDGRAEAMAAWEPRFKALEAAWVAAAMQWDAERRQMLLEARQSLLKLAIRMAEKIVHKAPTVDPSIVVQQVAQAISHVAGPCDVTIRIHPDDRPLVQECLPQLLSQFAQIEHAKLADDAAIAPGGCVVTYGKGRIDATLQTQLDRLIDALFAGGRQALDPLADADLIPETTGRENPAVNPESNPATTPAPAPGKEPGAP